MLDHFYNEQKKTLILKLEDTGDELDMLLKYLLQHRKTQVIEKKEIVTVKIYTRRPQPIICFIEGYINLMEKHGL